MPRHAAFLRGINVGGHRVKGPELAAVLEELGFSDVATFRASGNVVLDGGRGAPDRIAARIEKGLHAALGYEVAVFLRSADELRALAAAQPFESKAVAGSAGKLQVLLLSGRPAAGGRKKVLAHATDADRLAFGERELFWLPSGGILDSELDLKAIEGLVGQSTTRTKGTIEALAAKYFES